jgi:tetratricopeptide (TPR) repeat protein
VSPSPTLAEHLLRALYALLLAVAPTSLSPEPLAPRGLALVLWQVACVLSIAVIALLGRRFAIWGRSRLAGMAAALGWIAAAMALVVPLYYSGEAAPLLRGVPLVAVPLWAGLACAAAVIAGRSRDLTFRHRELAAAALVLAVGAIQIGRGVSLSRAPDRMWWAALWADPNHDRAVFELVKGSLHHGRVAEARRVADCCIVLQPSSCACLDLRVAVELAAHGVDAAVADARRATDQCPVTTYARAELVEALGQQGKITDAEDEARRGIEQGGPTARLRLALANAYNQVGRNVEALAEARRAIDAGAGRDAKLLAAALAILNGDLDASEALLRPLVAADANDADAQYDLGLCADKRGDDVAARKAYSAALSADPKQYGARYNLALLAWRTGSAAEGRDHVQRLREVFPDDPGVQRLAQTIAAPSPPSSPPR